MRPGIVPVDTTRKFFFELKSQLRICVIKKELLKLIEHKKQKAPRLLGSLGQDDTVEVAETNKGLYLSIALRGGYDDPRFAKAVKHLADWLGEHRNEYEQTGPPRVLAYNSPFMLGFLKYSEVQIPINRL